MAAAALLTAWSVLLMPFGWLIALLYGLTRSPVLRRLARSAGWFYGRSALWLLSPFLPVTIRNANSLRGRAPCIVVANHQSLLDLYLLGMQPESQVCPVSKSWPYRLLFFFAPLMRAAGYVEAEGRAADEVERQCRERLAEGAMLVFYPEGSRSRDGSLGRFHAGAFRLAIQTGVPLIPMVIHNSGEALPPEHKMLRPCRIRMHVLAPVRPQDFISDGDHELPHRSMLRHVRALFADALTRQPEA